MMGRLRTIFIFFLLAGCLAGCGVLSGLPAPNVKPSGPSPAEQSLQSAAAAEADGNVHLALAFYRAAEAQDPDNPTIRASSKALAKRIRATAEAHYRKGRQLRKKGKHKTAIHQFLAALAWDPRHKKAATALKTAARPQKEVRRVTVKKGETLSSLSERLYGTDELAFFIALLNNLPGKAALRKGQRLVCPRIQPDLVTLPAAVGVRKVPPPTELKKEFERAYDLAAGERYMEALQVIQLSEEYAPNSISVEEARNEICFAAGKKYRHRKEYRRALAMFSRVSSGYKGVEKVITDLNAVIRQKADRHYREGLKHFLDEELRLAITEWEAVLELDPDHPTAGKDIENARKLLEKLKKLE